jgi:hypothetical protein
MKATTVKEVLIAARDILVNKGWHQGSYGKKMDGENSDDLGDASCVAYCPIGAIFAVEAAYVVQRQAEDLLRKETPKNSIVAFNDRGGRTKEEVLELFDQAIEKVGQ